MPPGLEKLQHIVVLMMGSRSFDHMLGSLPGVGGIDDAGAFTNPDTNGNLIMPQALAEFQGQLLPSPDNHFPSVDLQVFGADTSANRQPNMQGFIRSYFSRDRDAKHSQVIMYYFRQEELPVLRTLALEYAVFSRWFASVPGPSICNRAFTHYGTSFGRVDLGPVYPEQTIKSIYNRLIDATPKRTARIYYYDTTSSAGEVASLLQNQPELFGTYSQFLDDCERGSLPDYSFIEPNYTDHTTDSGEEIANDQHPSHNVQAGELFIASVYQAIKNNVQLWENTALLVTYSDHGGIFDHVPPPTCTADLFTAEANATGTGMPFQFDRLGVRVPSVLVSPWIPRGTVINRVFDHASIPATVTKFFLGDYSPRSPREISADVFIEPQGARIDSARNLLSLDVMRTDCLDFDVDLEAMHRPPTERRGARTVIKVPIKMLQSAYDPNRPISSSLSTQIERLYEAEKRLPLRYQSGIYVNAIRTEGEAAHYIRLVTEAIHLAHQEADRTRTTRHRREVIEIAAMSSRAAEKRSQVPKRKSSSRKSYRKH